MPLFARLSTHDTAPAPLENLNNNVLDKIGDMPSLPDKTRLGATLMQIRQILDLPQPRNAQIISLLSNQIAKDQKHVNLIRGTLVVFFALLIGACIEMIKDTDNKAVSLAGYLALGPISVAMCIIPSFATLSRSKKLDRLNNKLTEYKNRPVSATALRNASASETLREPLLPRGPENV